MIYYSCNKGKVIQQQTEKSDYMIKFIKGNMVEGGKVTIEIDGKQVERVVRYNHMDGLYIVYKNSKYFEYECDYTEFYKAKERADRP